MPGGSPKVGGPEIQITTELARAYFRITAANPSVYVFCVYCGKKDRTPAKVLDLEQWEFYVVPTTVISEELRHQKTVVYNRIKSLTDSVCYSRLKERVDEALAHG